jgi:hypothetical protein
MVVKIRQDIIQFKCLSNNEKACHIGLHAYIKRTGENYSKLETSLNDTVSPINLGRKF